MLNAITQINTVKFAVRRPGSGTTGNVGPLMEHAGYGRRRTTVANPVRANLNPGLPRPRKRRIWPRRGQPDRRVALDQTGSFCNGCDQVPYRFRTFKSRVSRTEFPDLLLCPRGEFNQGSWITAVCLGRSASFASSCSAARRNSSSKGSSGTVCPAASWASLSSIASSHPAGAGRGAVSSWSMRRG